MSDYYFRKFYLQVKDPQWPDVGTYEQFKKLPLEIQQECLTHHGLDQRLEEITNADYWRKHGRHNTGYQYQNVVYVPVLKCASTYYITVFSEMLGWKQVQLDQTDWSNTTAFGLMMNPMTRRIKGVMEALCMGYQYDYAAVLAALESAGFSKFVGLINVVDSHSIPYSVLFGDYFDRINWIPMDLFTDLELAAQITRFLATKNVIIQLPETKRLNESSDLQLKIYQKLLEIYRQQDAMPELGMLYARDMKFYNRLIDTYAAL